MKKIILTGAVLGAPMLSLARGADAFSILGTIATFLSYVIPVLITVAVIYFIWSVIQYTITGDDKKKADAKKGIVSGLIGLFVIVAFWGILSLVTNTFGVGPEKLSEDTIPCIPNSAAGIYCD